MTNSQTQQPQRGKGKDIIDAYIEFMHRLLGHDRCADYMGVPRYDKRQCILCHPELRKQNNA